MNRLSRSRVIQCVDFITDTCGLCGHHGQLIHFDVSCDVPLCGECVAPTIMAERELVRFGLEHPNRTLVIKNP